MAREIPEVVRAAAGLAATVLDEARKLPETLPGLPVRVIGLAMQTTMRIQQHYVGLVARGDELLTGLRGENEPGLATFDDEIDDVTQPATTGYRESAFDRADLPVEEVPLTEDTTDLGDSDLPTVDLDTIETTHAAAKPGRGRAKKAAATKAAPAKKATRAKKSTPADQVEGAQQALDALPSEAPSTDEVLEELAIEEMVGEAPVAGPVDAGEPDVTADVSTTADDVTADVTTAAAPGPEAATATPEAPADTANGSQAPGAAPVDGYDGFSIAQLRGRLRGYQLVTVQDLLTYEGATKARAPYLRMLRNRLEKVEEQAVESSPLAPRS